MSFRKTIFWMHLIAGVIAGIVILIMCVTGVALTYEKSMIAWSERDARRIETPEPGTEQMPVEALLKIAGETESDANPSGLIFYSKPDSAVAISYGRSGAVYANPYTGEVRASEATTMRSFMRTMVSWHRWIALSGDSRSLGKAITGACNFAFLFLAVSGIYLWWPRKWTMNALKAILLFNASLKGKARDWNWHNVIGIWSALILAVLTATALPISYGWAGDLIYTLTGTEQPAGGSRRGQAGPPVEVPTPPAGANQLSQSALLAAVQSEFPDWKEITLRIPGGRGNRGGGPTAASFSIKEKTSWPRTGTTTVSLDPFTGSILSQSGFGDQDAARQVRGWTRFLHTGEALGFVGQTLAGLASLGGAFLVWTGLALSWRRFFGKKA
ncbi:MAG: PepSY-associated TM helix domain-containing protein [Opitutales bacterium]|jgi:uncharacterized iron-regulated membrane protein|nr:PepSY-associated TM helix domain-containing protein [Opitutales bacterium]